MTKIIRIDITVMGLDERVLTESFINAPADISERALIRRIKTRAGCSMWRHKKPDKHYKTYTIQLIGVPKVIRARISDVKPIKDINNQYIS